MSVNLLCGQIWLSDWLLELYRLAGWFLGLYKAAWLDATIINKMVHKKAYKSKRKGYARRKRGFKSKSSGPLAGYGSSCPSGVGYDAGYSAKCTLTGVMNNVQANACATLYVGWGMNPTNAGVTVHTASAEFTALSAVF